MNKPKTCVAMTFILLMLSVMLTAMPIQAQIISGTEYNHGGAAPGTPNGSVPLPAGVTPGFTVVVTPYLSFSPNPIGVGQTLLVNMWLNPANDFRRYFTNYTVSMIKPDGTAVTVGPLNSYAADTTSYFTYSPDQVGTWQLRFNFPGGFYPAGIVTLTGWAWKRWLLHELYAFMLLSASPNCLAKPNSATSDGAVLAASSASNRLLDKTGNTR